ncbi:bactofilin family protein [Paenibacillus guangzhouensis]|uniref:polymer-forming cytoskeletal protein n=1 Tax=Paenibacillus guangzhouensis TaxID=1473112 RepID=UPI0012674440|nr:polymer-forming cytoskeletal protein [Paenibacillus guangzhouensis]
MIDYTPIIVRSLQQIAEEINTIGLHETAVPAAIQKYNSVLSIIREGDPENRVWEIIQPLDSALHTSADLSIACNMLEKVVEELKRTENQTNDSRGSWHVFNPSSPLVIEGHYEGNIVVDPDCSCTIEGFVRGDVILHGNAQLVIEGKLDGNIQADWDAKIVNEGFFEGSVIQLEQESHH